MDKNICIIILGFFTVCVYYWYLKSKIFEISSDKNLIEMEDVFI